MAVDDVLTLRVVGRYQSQNIVNTLHYRITAQTSSEKVICSGLIAGFQADVQAGWLSRHIDTYTLIGYKCYRQSGVAKTPHFTSVGTAGSVVGEELPAFVCRTITLYTDSAIPQRRGRIMLSGTQAAMLEVTDGSLTSTEITSLNSLGATIVGAMDTNGDSFQLCIPAGTDHESNPIPVEDIIDHVARETPASVTSRRIKQFLVG